MPLLSLAPWHDIMQESPFELCSEIAHVHMCGFIAVLFVLFFFDLMMTLIFTAMIFCFSYNQTGIIATAANLATGAWSNKHRHKHKHRELESLFVVSETFNQHFVRRHGNLDVMTDRETNANLMLCNGTCLLS